jgi:hypothetical protein
LISESYLLSSIAADVETGAPLEIIEVRDKDNVASSVAIEPSYRT